MDIVKRLRKSTERLAKSKKMMTALAALGMIGLVMILFSGGDKSNGEKPKEQPAESKASAWTDYCSYTEKRLEELLSAIDGVGKVNVMVTVSSSEEYIYARADNLNGDRSEQEYVTVRTANGEEALVRKVNTPVIMGVAAVCEGGRSDRVREEVYRTVTSVLGIPSSRVYVAAME